MRAHFPRVHSHKQVCPSSFSCRRSIFPKMRPSGMRRGLRLGADVYVYFRILWPDMHPARLRPSCTTPPSPRKTALGATPSETPARCRRACVFTILWSGSLPIPFPPRAQNPSVAAQNRARGGRVGDSSTMTPRMRILHTSVQLGENEFFNPPISQSLGALERCRLRK